MPHSCGMSTYGVRPSSLWSAVVLPPLLRTKTRRLSKRYAQLPKLSLLLPCFRPVAISCTSDQFRQLHNPLKINRDRQSSASFPHQFRSTSQPAFGVLLRFSTSVRFPAQPSTLLTQKSQFVTPLFSWSYKLLFPQFLSFDKHLRCPPGCGGRLAIFSSLIAGRHTH
jgi:hypothetical protein